MAQDLTKEREALQALTELVDFSIWYPGDEKSIYPTEPITFIDFGDSDITDAGLAYLTHFERLEHLCLDETNITDAGLAHLSSLETLKVLELQGTDVTEAGVQTLRQKLPGCEILC